MKKLTKIVLKNADELNASEMKDIVGGTGNSGSACTQNLIFCDITITLSGYPDTTYTEEHCTPMNVYHLQRYVFYTTQAKVTSGDFSLHCYEA